ncbi:MAG: NCS2 family permease [Treponemataceae bacterium]
MEKFFKLKEKGSTVKTEILAGFTTFMTMAYILAVNPSILSAAGMDSGGVFTATALSSVIATLFMALVANLPFALAPGMGLNAFFAFSVVLGMGYSWQTAITAVFIEGLIFILLTLFNVREAIINSIPNNLKRAISVGIGLFIAFIGLQNAGIIINNEATLVGLGSFSDPRVTVALIGLILTAILLARKITGALLIGMGAATLIGIVFGVTKLASTSFMPPSIEPVFFKFDFSQLMKHDIFIVLFTFLFVDMFDTVGTLIGVCTKAKLLAPDGSIPRCKQALFADAIGTTIGACLGTSTVTTYVESASGVAEGGKTGLTALTTAILFGLSLFLSPLFLSIPGAATAPALILVGLFMMSPILEINFDDYTESVPAFICILFMPLTYSIADGIIFGVLAYIFIKALTGKAKEITPLTWILGIVFLFKLMYPVFIK